MMHLTTAERFGEVTDKRIGMYRLRYRISKAWLDWNTQLGGDIAMDEFAALRPVRFLRLVCGGQVRRCVQLLPCIGPTMFGEAFPALLDESPLRGRPSIWGNDRFTLDVSRDAQTVPDRITKATYELFAGMIEFGLSRRLTDIVPVTDVRMEAVLPRSGSLLQRIAEPSRLARRPRRPAISKSPQ